MKNDIYYMSIIQYFDKNIIGTINITDKHNGLINTACTASPGKICSIINAYGSALLNNWEQLHWTAGYYNNCWHFAADCLDLCLINSANGIGIMRTKNNELIPTNTFHGCSSYIQGPHIWTDNINNINIIDWRSAIIL